MAYGRVAAGALVLESGRVAWIGDDLVAHLGPPEGVLRAVGHERAPPVVHDVDVPAVGHGLHRERLSGDGGQFVGVFGVASGAFA